MTKKSFRLIILILILSVTSLTISLYIFQKNQEFPSIKSIIENESIFKESIDNEQYAVYSALIKDLYIDERLELLVLAKETSGCVSISDHKKLLELNHRMEDTAISRLSILLPQTVRNFQNKDKQCNLLDSKFSIPIKYVIANKDDISRIFLENGIEGWSIFYEKYPKSSGLITFSNVGFNSEVTQAFVHTGRGCGAKCGGGFYVVLQKEGKDWRVVAKFNSWVS